MTDRIVFVMPIRHPDGVPDRDEQLRTLAQSFASLAAQTSRQFEVRIACNPGQALPPLPEAFSVTPVDLPPNALLAAARTTEEKYAAVDIDKGQRIEAAVADLSSETRIMVVDDDDFVHRDLVAHALTRPGRALAVDKGYSWESDTDRLHPVNGFNRICGTCLIVPLGLYLLRAAPEAPRREVHADLGSHWTVLDRVAGTARRFRPVPFRAAIYRRGLSNSLQADATMQAAQAALAARPRSGLPRRALRKATRLVKAALDRHDLQSPAFVNHWQPVALDHARIDAFFGGTDPRTAP